MLSHPHLLQQLEELGLNFASPPADPVAWQQFLRQVEQRYTLSDAFGETSHGRLAELGEPDVRRQVTNALRTVLNHLSHDLRTPLSVLNSYLHLTRSKLPADAPEVAYLEIAQSQSGRIVRIIDDITTLSSLEFATDNFEFDRVNLNEILNELLVQFAAPTRAKQLAIQAVFGADLPEIPGDRLWLALMVKNLLNNAIQYSEPHGCIQVETKLRNDCVCLEIADSGVGIPEADLPHIFDHFFRSAAHRPLQGGGAGLGLTIVKKIVDEHRGKITVQSQVGQGTTVHVCLPASRP
jgi:signal transduction histidine kinase